MLLLVVLALLPAPCPPVALGPPGEREADGGSLEARAPCRIPLWRPRVGSSGGDSSLSTPSRSSRITRSITVVTVSRSQLKYSRWSGRR